MDDGDYSIVVGLVDEDGTHTNAGSKSVRSDPDAWARAWSHDEIGIVHKANYADIDENWTAVTLSGGNSSVLSGGDLFGGDLGVSAQSLLSSTIRQEVDGTEALKFELLRSATAVTVDVSRLQGDEASGQFEAGRLQLINASGLVVAEQVFHGQENVDELQISLAHSAGFTGIVLTTGVYEGDGFVFGGLADSFGGFNTGPLDGGSGTSVASDFLIDAVEFELAAVEYDTVEINLIGLAESFEVV